MHVAARIAQTARGRCSAVLLIVSARHTRAAHHGQVPGKRLTRDGGRQSSRSKTPKSDGASDELIQRPGAL